MICVETIGLVVLFTTCFRGYGAQMTTSQLEQEVSALKLQMLNMQSTIQDLHKQLNATSYLAALANSHSHNEPIAFTATLSSPIPNMTKHMHIVFDHEVTNVGGGYSNQNGHFTAPMFGLYAFFVVATNAPTHSASLSLMKNGQSQVVLLAHGTAQTPGIFDTSTMATTLLLNEGDQVWAQNEGQFTPVESLDGYHYSSFSGFLFHRM